MNHDEVSSDTWKDKKHEWLVYVKNDVICTSFSYARYSKALEKFTGFSMKDCVSRLGLGWKYLKSLRTEEHEPIYTYNDKYMRWLVRQSTKGILTNIINQKKFLMVSWNLYQKNWMLNEIIMIL